MGRGSPYRVRKSTKDLLATLTATHPRHLRRVLGAGGWRTAASICRSFVAITIGSWLLIAVQFAPTEFHWLGITGVFAAWAALEWYWCFGRERRGFAPRAPDVVLIDMLIQCLSRLVRHTRDTPVDLVMDDGLGWTLDCTLDRENRFRVRVRRDGTYVSIGIDATSDERSPWRGQQWPGIDAPNVLEGSERPATLAVRSLELLLSGPSAPGTPAVTPDTALMLAGLVAELTARAMGERQVASLLSARRAAGAGRFLPADAPPGEPEPMRRLADRHRSQPWAVAAPELTRSRVVRARSLRGAWLAAATLCLLTLWGLHEHVAPLMNVEESQGAIFALAALVATGLLNIPYFLPTTARMRVRVAGTTTAPVGLRESILYTHSADHGIDLAEPFQLALTRDPAEVAGAALLGVVISQSLPRSRPRKVRFSVPVRARDIAHLEPLTLDAPLMSPKPFAQWLWPTLRAYAGLHQSAPPFVAHEAV